MDSHTDYRQIELAARRRRAVRRAITYVLLALWAVIVLFPFYWMVLTSVKSYSAYSAERIPAFFTLSPTLQNYHDAFTAVPLGRYFLNTVIFTAATTAIMLAVITLAALLPLLWVFRKKRPEKSGVKGAATPSPGEAVSGKTDKTTIYRTKPE